MKKRIFSFVLAIVMLSTMLLQIRTEVEAATALSYAPYAQIEYSYTADVQCGTIRYINQNVGNTHYYYNYWQEWESKRIPYVYYGPGSECGTCSISMALSYIGINKTPKDILDYDKSGNTYFGLAWGGATAKSYTYDKLSTAMDNYIKGNGKYSPPVIHLYAYSGNHHVVLVGKIDNNTYQVLDPATTKNWSITVDGATATYTHPSNGAAVTDTINWLYDNGEERYDDIYQYYNPNASICTHYYNNLGICTSTCKQEYNWQATYDTSCAGIYKVSLGDGIYLRKDKPYAASTAKSEFIIKVGTEVKVLGSVLNAVGTEHHRWYKVSYNGIEGYTSENNITWVRENDKQPMATCDEVVGKNGGVYIRGWAFDPDSPSENVAIHVYIDDVLTGAYTAKTSRPDVNNVYGCGNNHGFEFTVPCNAGAHSIVVFAINTTYGEDAKGMGPFNVTVSSHTHSYTSTVTTAATCVNNGIRTYTCSGCGASYTETIAATGSHSYIGEVTTSATCLVDGVYTYTCSKCGESYTEAIPATGYHSWGAWGVIQDATCTTTGTRSRKCYVCWADEIESIPVKGHSYGGWVTTTEAGCATAGIQKNTCSYCGYVQTQLIAATGHSFQSSVIDATCNDYERIRYTCSKCQYYYDEYTNEKYSDWSTTKPTGVDESLIETKTQYRYADYQTTTSYETSLSGYSQISSTWQSSGSGTVQYVKNWPSGFSTGHSLYTTYNKSAKVASVTATEKTAIDSEKITGYLYYHWCRGTYADGPINRGTRPTQAGEFNSFHAFYSTTAPSSLVASSDGDGSYTYGNGSCCTDSHWYYCVPVYTQSYTTYRKLFTYGKWGSWSSWSDTVYTSSSTRQVETQKLYRYVKKQLGDHVWNSGAVTTNPSCTINGVKTYTCATCGITKTEAVAALNHNYQSGYCTRCDAKDPNYQFVTAISVKTQPTKTSYWIDEDLDITGLTLTAACSDGSTKTVSSGFTTTGFSSTNAGTKTVTVTYEGKTTTFNVTVSVPYVTAITVKTQPTKTSYWIGESLKTTGLTLTTTYSNGTTQTVSSGFTTSGFENTTAGTQTVTVTYEGKTTTFNVTVSVPYVTNISIKTQPTKTSYWIGESLNTTGLTLTATYSNGTTQTVSSGFTTSGFSSTTAGTKAVTVTYEGKTTTFNVDVSLGGVCGENLTWTLSGDGTLTISGAGPMDSWNASNTSKHPWYKNREEIRKVVINPGVTTIGSRAFYYCTKMTEVSIPDTVTSIGVSAFDHCEKLSAVTISGNVTAIGESAFESCMTLREITIPDSVTKLGNYAFQVCSSLEKAKIGNGITTIGSMTFYGCNRLAEVSIGNNVTSIGYMAFYGCPLNYNTYDNAKYLGSAVNPYIALMKSVSKDISACTIHENTKLIAEEAFRGCVNLTDISVPDDVVTISRYAFDGCTGLTDVHLGSEVTTIGVRAFEGCSGLSRISIPDAVTVIGYYAFFNCTGMTEVAIGSGMELIGEAAFADCSNLKDVYYNGLLAQWKEIDVESINASLLNATIHALDSVVELLELSIKEMPGKTAYVIGEKLNTTGLTLTASYSDGSTQTIRSDFSTSGFESATTGIKTVKVTYKGKTTTFAVTVRVPTIIDSEGKCFATMTEAIAAAQAGGTLELCQDIAERVTVSKTVNINLNGFDILSTVTVADGCTLYCFDSQTDDYTVNDGSGYGKITKVVGDVQGLPEDSDLAEDGYLMITEEDGVSFHRVNLQMTALTLRSSEAGVYYKSTFAGDELVAQNVSRFGVALSVKGMPEAENLEEKCVLSWFDGFEAGINGDNKNSTLLHGILKSKNSNALNAQNAAMPIYGRAYILTKDGQYLFGAAVSRSFQEQVEKVDAMWSTLTSQQQAEVAAMYQTYSNVMQNWALPNFQAALAPQVAMLPVEEENVA